VLNRTFKARRRCDQGNRVKASPSVSWQGHVLGLVPRITLPPTTFCADPSKVVGDRASEPGHDTKGTAYLCDVHPIALLEGSVVVYRPRQGRYGAGRTSWSGSNPLASNVTPVTFFETPRILRVVQR
jgi:hypothetical protein